MTTRIPDDRIEEMQQHARDWITTPAHHGTLAARNVLALLDERAALLGWLDLLKQAAHEAVVELRDAGVAVPPPLGAIAYVIGLQRPLTEREIAIGRELAERRGLTSPGSA